MLVTRLRSFVTSLRETLFRRLFRVRFRYDVFISYSHRDAKEYAANLKQQLNSLDFSCFIDEEESPPGSSLDPTLARALGKSAVLVLLATERALTRPYIISEFEKFAATERTIVPINILGALTKNEEEALTRSPWNLINERKLVWIDETDEAFAKKNPSPPIADGIDKLFKYTRRNVRVRTEIVGTAVLALLAAVGAGFVIKGQAKEVTKQAALAEVARKETAKQQDIANTAGKEAQRQLALAAAATKEADRQRGLAETAKKEAERQQELARQATIEANKQQSIAVGARLEAERQLDRSRHLSYVSDITLAQRAAEAGDMERVADLLEAHLPDTGKPDLRGFEWYHLWLTGRPRLNTLRNESGERALSIACSPDNRLLAVGRSQRVIEVWSLPDRKLLTAIHNQTNRDQFENWIEALSFTPDSKTLIFATFDSVNYWDVMTQKITLTFKVGGHTSSLAISPDGRMLATSSEKKVELWEIGSQKVITTLPGIEPAFKRTVRFSPDGRMLVTTQPSGNLELWSVTTWTRIGILTGNKYEPNQISFSPDGKLMATGSAADRVVRLWDIDRQKELATLKDHGSSLAFSPRGNMLAVSTPGSVRLLDPNDLSTLAILPMDLGALAFTPDGNTLAGLDYFDATLWDVTSQREQSTLTAPGFPIDLLAYHANGQDLSVLDGRDNISLWDLTTRTQKATIPGQRVAFSQDGRYLSIASEEAVKLYDGRKLKELLTIPGAGTATFSTDGNRMVIFNERRLTIWDTATLKKVKETTTADYTTKAPIVLSPDNRTLALYTVGFLLVLCDIETGKELAVLRDYDREAFAFSPDGRLLASGGVSGLKLFDVIKKKQIIELVTNSRVRAVAFSPDGRTLASASNSKTVMLWDLSNYQQTIILKGFALDVTAMVFSPDGKVLATGSYDGTVRLWFSAGAQEVNDHRRKD